MKDDGVDKMYALGKVNKPMRSDSAGFLAGSWQLLGAWTETALRLWRTHKSAIAQRRG